MLKSLFFKRIRHHKQGSIAEQPKSIGFNNLVVLIAVSTVLLSSCGVIPEVNAIAPVIQFEVVSTSVSNIIPTPTPIVIIPDPSLTSTPIPLPPTSTPTHIPPTPMPKTYCDWMSFVKDITIPDGTTIKVGDTFVKTWRLKNRGTCTWTPDYALVFSSGAQMGQTTAVRLPGYVTPGETIDISVALTAPASPGNYRGYWMLRNSSGAVFGYGDNANKAFYVDIKSVSYSYGTVSGRICYPSEHIPRMTLYLQNMSKNKLFRFPIEENQNYYEFQLEPGEYMAYAWTLNFDFAGGYTHSDHRLKNFDVSAGQSVSGIDICDWYGDPGTIPLPKAENYGTITGKLSFPSEQIPPLRIVAFDIYNDAYHWVDTVTNQQSYEITGLMPGYYTIVAYTGDIRFAGGYTEYAKCGLGLSSYCPEDHTLVVVYVTPGMTIKDIDPADWYAPEGTFPPDPTP